MINVALPAAIGMELGSIRRIRLFGADLVEAELVEGELIGRGLAGPGATRLPPQPAARSASNANRTFMFFLALVTLTIWLRRRSLAMGCNPASPQPQGF